MALETLRGVEKIGGFDVGHDPTDNDNFGPNIGIFHDVNTIAFKIQDGPIKENGVNGCRVDTLIHAAKMILEGLNKKFPSPYNDKALLGLNMALVEGTSKA